tara:strand:- start:472 stop:939 length:468 start_codon:yes stop_codon:yes gene_type:complete
MMLENENPENDPLTELYKELNSNSEKQKPTRKGSKSRGKKAVKKTAKQPTKKTIKKPARKRYKKVSNQMSSSQFYNLMQAMDADPVVIEYRNNITAVTSKVYEHLNSFILIGYTEDGEPVQVTSARTPKDYDALSTALQKYLMELIPKGPPPPGF